MLFLGTWPVAVRQNVKVQETQCLFKRCFMLLVYFNIYVYLCSLQRFN